MSAFFRYRTRAHNDIAVYGVATCRGRRFLQNFHTRPKARNLGKLISAFATGTSRLGRTVRAADRPVVTGFKSGGEHNIYNHGHCWRTCYYSLNV